MGVPLREAALRCERVPGVSVVERFLSLVDCVSGVSVVELVRRRAEQLPHGTIFRCHVECLDDGVEYLADHAPESRRNLAFECRRVPRNAEVHVRRRPQQTVVRLRSRRDLDLVDEWRLDAHVLDEDVPVPAHLLNVSSGSGSSIAARYRTPTHASAAFSASENAKRDSSVALGASGSYVHSRTSLSCAHTKTCLYIVAFASARSSAGAAHSLSEQYSTLTASPNARVELARHEPASCRTTRTRTRNPVALSISTCPSTHNACCLGSG